MKTKIFNGNTVARNNTTYVLLTKMYNDTEEIIDCDTFDNLKKNHLQQGASVYSNIMNNFDYYIVSQSEYTKSNKRDAKLDMYLINRARLTN